MLTAALFLAASLGYYSLERSSVRYHDANAIWVISGICIDAQDGLPIEGADITVYFAEPIRFKHHWGSALRTTNVITKSDAKGSFLVTGEGGHAKLKATARGYKETEPWNDWRHTAKRARVDTNLLVTLNPKQHAHGL